MRRPARRPSSLRPPARRECRRTDRGGPWWRFPRSRRAVDRFARGVRIEEVGFTAKRTTIGWPVEMPPSTPPAWFERKRGLPSLPGAHFVGVLFAGECGGGEARADLDALHRVDAHHRARRARRRACRRPARPSRRARRWPALRSTAPAEEPALRVVVEEFFPARGGVRVGAPERIVLRLGPIPFARDRSCAGRSAPARRGSSRRRPAPCARRAPAATRAAVSRAEERPPPR